MLTPYSTHPWREKVTNSEVLERAGTNSMFALFGERRLRWLGHIRHMEASRIPKDLLYGELAEGSHPVGRPRLCFSDVCKRDLKRLSIPTTTWEDIADDRVAWCHAVRQGVLTAEVARNEALVQTRVSRKQRELLPREPSTFGCATYSRECHSRIGLFSHSRKCGPPGCATDVDDFVRNS